MNLLGGHMGTGDIDAIILGGNGYRLQILKIKDGAMESDVELIIGTLIWAAPLPTLGKAGCHG